MRAAPLGNLMKITRIESIPVRVPHQARTGNPRRPRPFTQRFTISVSFASTPTPAYVGIGEASCTPRWSGEDQVTAAHFVDNYFAPQLVGETLDDVLRLTAKFSGTVANNYFTKSAVEMALWDLAGKAARLPGLEVIRTSALASFVPTKWSVSGVAPAKAAEIAAWAVSQGFTKMKVKVGIDPPTDIDRVRAVRAAVGPNIKLGIDANGGWPTPAIAIPTINRLCDECNIYFAEQPVPPGDHAALAEVRRNVPVPIIADESIYTLADAKMLARAEAADVFSIYVGKAGGIGPAFEIAEIRRIGRHQMHDRQQSRTRCRQRGHDPSCAVCTGDRRRQLIRATSSARFSTKDDVLAEPLPIAPQVRHGFTICQA